MLRWTTKVIDSSAKKSLLQSSLNLHNFSLRPLFHLCIKSELGLLVPRAYVHCVEAFCLWNKPKREHEAGQEKTCKKCITTIHHIYRLDSESEKMRRTKEVWSATKSREAAINKHIQTLVAIHHLKLRWCKLRSLVSTKGFWAKVLHIRFHQWSDAGILCDKILGTAYHGSNVTPTRAETQKPCHFKNFIVLPFFLDNLFPPQSCGNVCYTCKAWVDECNEFPALSK